MPWVLLTMVPRNSTIERKQRRCCFETFAAMYTSVISRNTCDLWQNLQ